MTLSARSCLVALLLLCACRQPAAPPEPQATPRALQFSVQPAEVVMTRPFPVVPEVTLIGATSADDGLEVTVSLQVHKEVPGTATLPFAILAKLGGVTTANLEAGVARFPGLDVNHGGYFALTAVTGELSVESAVFQVVGGGVCSVSSPATCECPDQEASVLRGCIGPETVPWCEGCPTELIFDKQPSGGTAGQPLSVQPHLKYGDAWLWSGHVTLSLTGGTPGAALLGDTDMACHFWDRYTCFHDIAVSVAGSGYIIRARSGVLSVDSEPFDVAP